MALEERSRISDWRTSSSSSGSESRASDARQLGRDGHRQVPRRGGRRRGHAAAQSRGSPRPVLVRTGRITEPAPASVAYRRARCSAWATSW
jgi:hypothetical protein